MCRVGWASTPRNATRRVLDFIRKSHQTTTWTVGICNGVEILATAGILDGVEVTTNYFARDRVVKLGGKVLKTRYHRDGKDRHRGRRIRER